MPHDAREPLTPAEEAAFTAYLEWRGLCDAGDNQAALTIGRRIRQQICQTAHRSKYSRNSAGTDDDCMRGMSCAIIEEIRRLVRGPKGGLSWIFHIHPSRFQMVFDLHRWPPKAEPVRHHFAEAVWWMFMGSDWKDWRARLDKMGNDRTRLHKLENDPDRDRLWLARTALDVIDYFFPTGEITPQPYFSSVRRAWDSSFDIGELLHSIRWTRRMYSQFDPIRMDGRQGRIAIFISSEESLNRLFSEKTHLLRELAHAAMENPSQLLVHILHPHWLDAALVSKYQQKMIQFAHREYAFRCDRYKSGRAIPSEEWVQSIWSKESATERPKPEYKVLRAIVSFFFFGYSQPNEQGLESRYDRLYVVRPMKPDRHPTPFSISMSDEETNEFMTAAMSRYADFSQSYINYMGSNKRLGIVRSAE